MLKKTLNPQKCRFNFFFKINLFKVRETELTYTELYHSEPPTPSEVVRFILMAEEEKVVKQC